MFENRRLLIQQKAVTLDMSQHTSLNPLEYVFGRQKQIPGYVKAAKNGHMLLYVAQTKINPAPYCLKNTIHISCKDLDMIHT